MRDVLELGRASERLFVYLPRRETSLGVLQIIVILILSACKAVEDDIVTPRYSNCRTKALNNNDVSLPAIATPAQ